MRPGVNHIAKRVLIRCGGPVNATSYPMILSRHVSSYTYDYTLHEKKLATQEFVKDLISEVLQNPTAPTN